jgi:hypothetical protein
MLRYLRIAFTVACGSVCLLLVALWVRSGWWQDGLGGQLPGNRTFSLSAAYGRVRYATFDKAYEHAFTGFRRPDWYVTTSRMDGPPNLKLVNTPLAEFGLGLAGSSDQYGIVAVFPIWAPAMVLALLGAAPWIVRRYSLRTLLVAMTLVAVGLGVTVCVGRSGR